MGVGLQGGDRPGATSAVLGSWVLCAYKHKTQNPHSRGAAPQRRGRQCRSGGRLDHADVGVPGRPAGPRQPRWHPPAASRPRREHDPGERDLERDRAVAAFDQAPGGLQRHQSRRLRGRWLGAVRRGRTGCRGRPHRGRLHRQRSRAAVGDRFRSAEERHRLLPRGLGAFGEGVRLFRQGRRHPL